MKPFKIIPILSVLIGILAFILTFQYLRSERRKLDAERARIYEGAQKILVMAARQDIPSGTVIRPKDLGTISVYKSHAGTQMVLPEDAEMLFGRKTLFSIKALEPVLWSCIEGGSLGGRGLGPIIKPGLRALSIAVSGAEAVSGLVQPNDRVDVLGTFSFPSKSVQGEMETVTLTVLQDVTVYATGQRLAKQQGPERYGAAGGGYSTVTLEVTPREAELLVFAQQIRGRLTLALRHPEDASFKNDLPEIDFTYLEKELPKLNLDRQREIRHKSGPELRGPVGP